MDKSRPASWQSCRKEFYMLVCLRCIFLILRSVQEGLLPVPAALRLLLFTVCITLQICAAAGTTETVQQPVPVIDVTDLYHYYQDPGDNLDLIAAYALPEIDLKAIVLDVTEAYRPAKGKHPGLPEDVNGPRDPGFIPVLQMNRIFDRVVPVAAAPFRIMKSPDDQMRDAPKFEQEGVDLLLRTLRESPVPMEILSFGSARPVAVAYNREPDLLMSKVRRIHLSAGATGPGFMEWNVMLDPLAIIRLLRSPLPIAIYPCEADTAYSYGSGNTFWKLKNLEFLSRMAPPLQRYLAYAFEKIDRPDFLRAVEGDSPAHLTTVTLQRSHNMWETAIWLNVSGRKLVRRADGRHAIMPGSQVISSDHVFPNDLKPCRVEVNGTGEFRLHVTDHPTTKWMYYRGDAKEHENALREAFTAWYISIRP